MSAEVPREELSAETLATALDRLLGSSIIAQRCRQFAGMVRSAEGLNRTCELIEGIASADLPEREGSASTA